jgi:serine/threonine protein kinase
VLFMIKCFFACNSDLKPENLIVALRPAPHESSPTDDAGGSSGGSGSTPLIKLADFGSANTDGGGLPRELWPPPYRRPSRAEETEDYSPPEVGT